MSRSLLHQPRAQVRTLPFFLALPEIRQHPLSWLL
jgi:hypothetical protein